MTKRDLVITSTRHHRACLLKYYPPNFVKSRMLLPIQAHFLLFQQIFFILLCIQARNPRVPPRVLASGPKPCGGNNNEQKFFRRSKVKFCEIMLSRCKKASKPACQTEEAPAPGKRSAEQLQRKIINEKKVAERLKYAYPCATPRDFPLEEAVWKRKKIVRMYSCPT